MKDEMIVIGVIGIIFYIIFLIMEQRAKNFIYEKHLLSFSVLMLISMNLGAFVYRYGKYGTYNFSTSFVTGIVIFGGYMLFQKNRIYFFKGIDKKLIKENRYEIIQIIDDYKAAHAGDESNITLVNKKIVFENVTKAQAEECLSLIGRFLDKNRNEYTLKDYMICFIKENIIFVLIIFGSLYVLFRLI